MNNYKTAQRSYDSMDPIEITECVECGREFKSNGFSHICPDCVEGYEIYLDSLED